MPPAVADNRPMNHSREAHAGILFHAPDNVIREFPQFPAVHTYEDLKKEFLKASVRNLSL